MYVNKVWKAVQDCRDEYGKREHDGGNDAAGADVISRQEGQGERSCWWKREPEETLSTNDRSTRCRST